MSATVARLMLLFLTLWLSVSDSHGGERAREKETERVEKKDGYSSGSSSPPNCQYPCLAKAPPPPPGPGQVKCPPTTVPCCQYPPPLPLLPPPYPYYPYSPPYAYLPYYNYTSDALPLSIKFYGSHLIPPCAVFFIFLLA